MFSLLAKRVDDMKCITFQERALLFVGITRRVYFVVSIKAISTEI
jgi:hypothetical protein